ncbi:ABC transporter ATP-binding protein [Variovorax sp. NFACC27]|uniref:ABC transporter ATP-binding protein n=1 Tax=unclassified Variovorax TaxID=663243 RepID=UPI00089BFF79|nr:peptide/nickel transport system ATP-binding protein [Variovorax sp. NFACC28]SEG69112.1 peptide/nickel transport system ATP-binding protein [Variovorax sp. NFACC29]SFC85080.1 peptide/nickel transport system ATP-binding protein [Variovorax sp. NFACC26]SFF97205.1 peptide/nickel transport system ATP-binding protein [Variovorax sp. NFACC27]
MSSQATPLVSVEGLTITVGAGGREIVRNVSFDIAPGEMVGIVGESGSGKTQAARAVMGLTPPPLVRAAGRILFEGEDLAQAKPARLRELRGARVGMVFQEPMTSLNPSMTIGRQLGEALALHRRNLSPAVRQERILDMLARVGIRDPKGTLDAWPHEFSGGMRQRMMLASVMLLEPALLIADEPTTALDAVVQRDVLELMVGLTREHSTAVLMISHDLPMVARFTQRMVVMRHGEVKETGRTDEMLERPKHEYTRELLQAMPRRLPARQVTDQAPVVEVRNLVVDYAGHRRLFAKATPKRALHGIDLVVRPREVVAVVGGSGSGKTTLGRTIAGLLKPSGGEILFNGRPILRSDAGWSDYRLQCQMVFQDPYASLDPRMTIGQLVGEGLRLVKGMPAPDKARRVQEVLDEVGLGTGFAQRYAHELSGGQRQRVAIARAIVRRPSFVIADEPVSALDVTVRAQVLELFAELQKRHGFSCLFISHDLGVVEQVADRVIVMQDGRIVEQGSRDTVFDAPQQDYTRKLLSAIPALEPTTGGGVRLRWRFGAESPAPATVTASPSAPAFA